MSREWVLKTLVGLGLSRVEAEIYLFLAQTGPLRGTEIADMLKLYKQQLYRSLRKLQCKGCVKATIGRPALFSAVSLEEVLDQFMKSKEKQAKILAASRDELLSAWRSLPQRN
jgi:sugar-specific transcriptional regulator TrmB